jgi:hypothetical protein
MYHFTPQTQAKIRMKEFFVMFDHTVLKCSENQQFFGDIGRTLVDKSVDR